MLQLAIILMMFGSCSQEKMVKYTGKNHEMLYPASWAKQEKSNAIFFLSPKENEKDLFQENVNLMLQDLSQQSMSLEQYTELTKKQVVDNFGASAIISLKNTTIAGQQGKEFVYSMNYQGRSLKLKQYWFIKGNIAYLFSYTADPTKYEKYESVVTEMIKSFKIF
ncbi:MAG TPA: PsbP-related protein [Bacteroidales bacterium]|nr:PsbP-related protein [Bacteroidales bacterium]